MNPKEEFQAFLDKQASADYDFASMTEEEQIQEQIEYTKLKLAAQKYSSKVSEFYAQRDEAFRTLEAKYQADREVLSAEWQAKESQI